ncbi:hypothetical protein [Actinoplanes utahensis]|uniref:Uncharacterized protein n=1 Tax=Actinoplanes utahensis TaxID=1869 RepID=A0A0A6UUK8_ACTUT|nr:hypothetical protein [Actinoplanes utahensis]KHD78653.1 hypothetical protein MB27_03140 [Actinoplanes utahensis]GIF31981.1 hypothetical protein Aut01nite_49670 [Actinoplanes utahensis]
MGVRQRRPAREGETFLDWAVKYASPLLTVAGVLLYGVLRLAYVTFYMQLRATPQEVGYGYVEILSSQLIGTVELVLVVAVLLFGPAVAVRGGYGLFRPLRRPWREAAARLAAQCALAAVALVLTLLPVAAWLAGTEARKGYLVRNVYLAYLPRIPVLAVQAVPASAAWSAEHPDRLLNLMDRRCLLYLGQNPVTTVFYDVKTRDSLRVPTAQIIVQIKNRRSVPVDC